MPDFFSGKGRAENFSRRASVYPMKPQRAGTIPAFGRWEGGLELTKREQQLSDFLVEEQARFYRLAYSYLKNREEALDAVQTAVCRALERQGSLRDAAAMKSWFFRILVNTCMDALRQRGCIAPLPQEEAGVLDPEPEDGSLVRRVDALPPEQGTVIRLRFYEELTLKEISAVTGWNLSTVKTRLYTALRKLRISMEGEYGV